MKQFLKYTFLGFIWAILAQTADAQCTLSATSSGGNAGYTQIYVLVDANSDIVAENNTGTFTSVAAGIYHIHALNYNPADAPAPLPSALIGQPLVNVGSSTAGCFNSDFLTDFVVRACGTCFQTNTVCETDAVIATSSSGNAAYTQLYVLVNAATGLVVATNGTGNFTGMVTAGNSYQIYALNYNPADAPSPLPTVGQAVSLVGTSIAGCFNNDFLLDFVCFNITPCVTTCFDNRNICVNEDIIATASNSAAGYTQIYVLTDDNGLFLAQNNTGIFSTLGFTLGATYHVHALNYNPLDAPAPLPSALVMGTPISTITSGCFNSDFLTDYLCFTIGCPCTGKLVQYAPNQAIPGNAGATNYTIASAYCDDISGWRYYYDPTNPNDLLFAINHKPVGGNTNDFTARVTIGVNDFSTTTGYDEPAGGQDYVNYEANFGMGRYWDVDVLSGSLNGNVNIRFYYPITEYNTTNTAAAAWKTTYEPAAILAGYAGLVQLASYWFKTNDATAYAPAPDLLPTDVNAGNKLVLNPDFIGTNASLVTNNKNYVEFDNQISSFSGGTVAFRVTPIAVLLENVLLSFDGVKVGTNNQLFWSVDKEQNVSHYILERSQNAIQTEQIATQLASGQTNYNYLDTEPYNRTYYRLKIVKNDGSYDYTNWVVLERNRINDNVLIYPNPTDGQIVIDFVSEDEHPLTFSVVDVLGREVIQQKITTNIGTNRHLMDMSHLASAVYILKIGEGSQQIIRKITKL